MINSTSEENISFPTFQTLAMAKRFFSKKFSAEEAANILQNDEDIAFSIGLSVANLREEANSDLDEATTVNSDLDEATTANNLK